MTAQVIQFPRQGVAAVAPDFRRRAALLKAEALTATVNLDRALCGRESCGLTAAETCAAFGVAAGDLLIIDQTLKPRYDDLVAYECGDGYLVTQYMRKPPAELLGVVRFIVHAARGGAVVKEGARREG